MSSEILGVLTMFLVTLALAWPLGRYIARVYAGERVWTDPIFGPVERLIFRVSGINSRREDLERTPEGPADRQPGVVPADHVRVTQHGLAPAEPRRQPFDVAGPGLQHDHFLRGQLQFAALQR